MKNHMEKKTDYALMTKIRIILPSMNATDK